MTRCAAINCKNMGIHLFPRDPKRRKLWELALRRKNWNSSKSSRLCAAHFKVEDYFGRTSYTGDEPIYKFLKKTAVPSIFSFTKMKSENLLALERSHRILERSLKELNNKKLSEDNAEPITYDITDVSTDEDMPLATVEQCTLSQSKTKMPGDDNAGPITDDITDQSTDETTDEDEPLATEEQCTLAQSKSTQVNFLYIYGSIVRYKNNDKLIAFYSGFETYAKFQFVFHTLSPMAHLIKYYRSRVENVSIEDQFFMTMMKLRQNKCNIELAEFFQISQTTVYNIFITWINYMDQLWSKFNIWPDKDLVLYYMPETYKKNKNTRVKRKITMSGNSVSDNTPAYAGSVSEEANSGYIIQDMFIGQDISLDIPTFIKGQNEIPGLKLPKDRKPANQRAHIERLIGITKTFKILNEELHNNYTPLASKIFFVCLMCSNFRESIK